MIILSPFWTNWYDHISRIFLKACNILSHDPSPSSPLGISVRHCSRIFNVIIFLHNVFLNLLMPLFAERSILCGLSCCLVLRACSRSEFLVTWYIPSPAVSSIVNYLPMETLNLSLPPSSIAPTWCKLGSSVEGAV